MSERELLDMLHARYSHVYGGAARYVCAEHVGNATGYRGDRRADFLVQDTYTEWVGPDGRPARPTYRTVNETWVADRHDGQERTQLHGFEIKVSRSDWLRELKDPSKAEAWKQYCDRWWLVAPADVIKPGELPDGWGLLVPKFVALRVKVQAPRLDPEPMPPRTRAALLRATAATAQRRAANRLGVAA